MRAGAERPKARGVRAAEPGTALTERSHPQWETGMLSQGGGGAGNRRSTAGPQAEPSPTLVGLTPPPGCPERAKPAGMVARARPLRLDSSSYGRLSDPDPPWSGGAGQPRKRMCLLPGLGPGRRDRRMPLFLGVRLAAFYPSFRAWTLLAVFKSFDFFFRRLKRDVF